MTDLFLEDDDDARPRALDRLRAEVSRRAGAIEHRLHDTASNAMEDARMLVRRAQRRINTHLGVSALAALGIGVALGLIVALIASQRGRER